MAKITWDDRTNSGEESKISASIFNDTKASVNALYDIIEAQLGNTSSTAEEDLIISGTIYVSGSIIPSVEAGGDNTSSFDLGSETAAWKDIYVSQGSIKYVQGGVTSSFSKADVDKLKAGKSISATATKQVVNENDTTTYVRMSTAGRAYHYASDKALIKLQTSSFGLGDTTVPASLVGSSIAITGSTTISGSTTNTGSFANTGSFTNEGTGSFTGSVETSGSVIHTGSTNTLPPPLVTGDGPITNTLYYGYVFTGGNPDNQQVEALNYDPNSITYFRFSTSSQQGYGTPTYLSSSQVAYFNGLSDSASNAQYASLTFTPTSFYPSHSYKFTVNAVIDSSSNGYYQANVAFVESSSLGGGTAPTFIEQSGGGANGRWKFIIPPLADSGPTGGWAVGDLLNVLATFGQTGIPTGSIGDYNFDGAVNVTDLITVLSGYSNGNTICGQDVLVPQGTNHQLIGPVISICDGNVFIIASGSFSSITL